MYLVYGTIAVFLITFFTLFVYFKKPAYGISLAAISIIFISLAIFWNITEDSRDAKALEKIPLQQIRLSQQSLQPAYGNHYVYKAELENLSVSHQLISVQLQLSLPGEQIIKWLKVWLAPEKKQKIDVYFASTELAQVVEKDQWKVIIIASRARN